MLRYPPAIWVSTTSSPVSLILSKDLIHTAAYIQENRSTFTFANVLRGSLDGAHFPATVERITALSEGINCVIQVAWNFRPNEISRVGQSGSVVDVANSTRVEVKAETAGIAQTELNAAVDVFLYYRRNGVAPQVSSLLQGGGLTAIWG